MAATNFTPISLYHTSTPGMEPDGANLVAGELALNIPDGKLFFKDTDDSIVLLASKATSSNVTSVSLVTANGFAGTVANPTTTPAITLTTTATGILKGSAGSLIAAASGVDYAPATTGSSILYANGSGGFSSVTIGSNLTFAGGTLSATGGGSSGVSSFNTRTGAVSLLSVDVTNALGYTPVQPSGTGASGTWGINISGLAATATTAASCSGNAATATTAAACSGNSATATTAAACSGNSATVTNGVYTTGDQSIGGGKTFTGSITSQSYNFASGVSIYYSGGLVATSVSGGGSWITSGGDFTITGSTATKASGTTWTNPSDARLKDNVTNFSKGLSTLVQVQPRTWTFNGKGGSKAGQVGIGVIADEIQNILPETVTTYKAKLNPTDVAETEIKQFNADEIIWILVNSVKELKAEVDALKAAK